MENRKSVNRGFTLIELVVVMVIIGILAVISIPMYRNYVQRARSSEGVALAGAVASSEKVYFAEHGSYLAVASTAYNSTLGVDATQNSYFNAYAVAVNATGDAFTVTSSGTGDASGISIVMYQAPSGAPVITVNGL